MPISQVHAPRSSPHARLRKMRSIAQLSCLPPSEAQPGTGLSTISPIRRKAAPFFETLQLSGFPVH